MPAALADFVNGVDFTLYVNQTAAMHNLLVSGGTPAVDRGLVVQTTDTALGVPDVPNATVVGYEKWKVYIWKRVPHASDPNTVPLLYSWNDNAVNDATYLKWQRITVDLTVIEGDITDIETQITNIQNDVNNALTTAGNALTVANNALLIAQSAEETANNANSNAQQAAADAAAALAAANGAVATANSALAMATTAKNTADETAALVAASLPNKYRTPVGLETALVPGLFYTQPHGLNGAPDTVTFKLVCTTADAGYAVGDELDVGAVTFEGGTDTDGCAFSCFASATHLYATLGVGVVSYRVNNGTTGAHLEVFTYTSWKLKVCAVKYPA